MATSRKPAARAGDSPSGTVRKTAAKTAGKPAAKPAATAAAAGAAEAAAPVAAPKSAASRRVPAAKAGTARREIGAEQRAHYVEVAAYYIAERRGFAPGDPLADWLAAEDKIDRLIAEGKLG